MSIRKSHMGWEDATEMDMNRLYDEQQGDGSRIKIHGHGRRRARIALWLVVLAALMVMLLGGMDKAYAEESLSLAVYHHGQVVDAGALKMGQSYQVGLKPADGWSDWLIAVDNPDIAATVMSNFGIWDLILIQPGNTTIRLYAFDDINHQNCLAILGINISASEPVPPQDADPEPIQRIVISPPPSHQLLVGESMALTAQVDPDDGQNHFFSWYSDNESCAMIDPFSGTVTGFQPGTTKITAGLSGNISDPIELEVVAPPIPNPQPQFSIVPLFDHAIQVEDMVYFSLNVQSGEVIPSAVTWEVAAPDIASVAPISVNEYTVALLAKMPGETELIARVGEKTASHAVEVSRAFTGIEVAPPDQTIVHPGTQLQLQALGLPERTQVQAQWSSSDPAIARVDASGTVTCVGERLGDVLIYATLPSGTGNPHTDFIRLSVVSPVNLQVALTATANNQSVRTDTSGGAQQYTAPSGTLISLRATLSGAKTDQQGLEWRVVSGNIALSGGSVSAAQPTNSMLATNQADAVVTVHCLEATSTQAELAVIHPSSGASKRILLTIIGKEKIGSVEILRPGSTQLQTGQYLNLYANVYKENRYQRLEQPELLWTSNNPRVATVGEDTGIVKALSSGEVVITATSKADTNKYDTIVLTVSGDGETAINAELVVLSGSLNVRAQPNTQGKIVNLFRPLRMGDRVQVQERTADGKWCRIAISAEEARSNGISQNHAYVAAAYVGQPAAVSVKAQSLNVRSNPNVQGAIAGRLALGDRVQALSRQGAWMGVVYNGKVCYVSAAHIDQQVTGQVTSQTLAVRTSPNSASTIKHRITNQNQLEILSREGHWYRVLYEGTTAYVAAGYVNII